MCRCVQLQPDKLDKNCKNPASYTAAYDFVINAYKFLTGPRLTLINLGCTDIRSLGDDFHMGSRWLAMDKPLKTCGLNVIEFTEYGVKNIRTDAEYDCQPPYQVYMAYPLAQSYDLSGPDVAPEHFIACRGQLDIITAVGTIKIEEVAE